MDNLANLSNSVVPVPREQLEALLASTVAMHQVTARIVAVLTEKLDLADGDPDDEENDPDDAFITPARYGAGCKISDPAEEDDDAGQCSEDEISTGNPFFGARGAGCIISDPDASVDDQQCDAEVEDGI